MKKALSQSGRSIPSKNKFRAVVKLPFVEGAKKLGVTNIPDAELNSMYLKSMMLQASEVHAFSDVRVTLSRLVNHNYAIGLVTEAPRKLALKYLNSLKLELYFRLLVTNDDVRAPKPSPEPILKALEVLGYDNRKVVYVGDMVEDVIAAKRAKVFSCAVYRRRRNFHTLYRLKMSKPDILITSLDQLEQRIKTLT